VQNDAPEQKMTLMPISEQIGKQVKINILKKAACIA
jgi:hypothetical protein